MAIQLKPISLAAFIVELEGLVSLERRPHLVAEDVGALLPRLLADPGFLAPKYREPDPERYRTQVLAITPSGRASVVAMVWLPGQMTPIHDHITWCVVGVLEGTEREERFSLRADGRERWLAPAGEGLLAPGETSVLVPPAENIHRVRNAGQSVAISIHVYGADIGRLGSSINARFDDLPVRPEDHSGTPVAWRQVRAVEKDSPR